MPSTTLYAVLILLFIVSAYFLARPKEPLSSFPLPPGPPALPVLGNIHQAPKSYAWVQYDAWGQEYGPIVHLNMAGQSVILLTSTQAAHDILNKQGAVFSDRPHFVVASELAHNGMHMLLRPYDARFKMHQKLQTPLLNEWAAKAYLPLQELESKQLLFDLLDTATEKGIDCHGQIERTTASVVYALLYSQRLYSSSDRLLVTAHQVNHVFDSMVQVGAYLVDAFPFLNFLPGPLAPWKAEAAKQWQNQSSLHLENLKTGLGASGWNLCKQMNKAVKTQGIEMPEVELALNLGIIANAALDGSTETAMWFLTACVATETDKAWIAKAQAQLDAVVGHKRFPTFDDRPNLPYIDAILDEVKRWRPAGAAGVPHFNKTEATYNGYRIPKNSVILPILHSIAREKGVYGLKYDVEKFEPERWLQADAAKLPDIGFGYGRRICPGRNVARNSLWIAIARILWAFDVLPGIGDDGKPAPVSSTKGTDGLVNKPFRFKASFKPRGDWARELITKDGNPHGVDHASMLDYIGTKRDWQ